MRLPALLCLAMLACGDDDGGGAADAAGPDADPSGTAVAIVWTGGRGDLSFNDTAAAGIDRAVAELGVTAIEVDLADFNFDGEAAIADAAGRADLVFVLGFDLGEPLFGV